MLHDKASESNFAVCLLPEIPLREFPFQMKLFETYRTPKHNTNLICQRNSFEKEIPLKQEAYRKHYVHKEGCPGHPTLGKSIVHEILVIRIGCTWNQRVPGPFLASSSPNLPTNITPTKIAWLKLSGKFPMDMRIPPLRVKIMLESNPLKSRILVGRLAF